MTPEVTVGILVRDRESPLIACANSLLKSDPVAFSTVIIDDGSGCASISAIQESYQQVTVITNPEPLGSAEGFNQVIRFAIREKSNYCFIMPSDLNITPDTLSRLVSYLKEKGGRGIVLPEIICDIPPADLTRDWASFVSGHRFLKRHFFDMPKNLKAAHYPFNPVLVAMKGIESVGFSDPFYFDYYADIDWLGKIKAVGQPVFTDSGICLAPLVQSRQLPHRAGYYRIRNLLHITALHNRKEADLFALSVLFVFIMPVLLRGILSREYRLTAQWLLLAIFDWMRKKRGMRSLVSATAPPVRTAVDRDKLLVRILWNLGDEVMALPAFEVLKRKNPDKIITAQLNYPDLVKGNPYVTGIDTKFGGEPEAIFDLRSEARGKSRLSHLATLLGTDQIPRPRVYLTQEEVAAAGRKWGFQSGVTYIGLSTSAKWFARRWEREKWEQLVCYLEARANTRVFVLGKGDEKISGGFNLMGQTDVREVAAILSLCDLFVGCDSGLVHLALAVDTPVVGLFGPLNPDYLIKPRDTFVSIWSDVECRGCWSDARMKHPDHCPKVIPDCLSSISVERVLTACNDLLRRTHKKDANKTCEA